MNIGTDSRLLVVVILLGSLMLGLLTASAVTAARPTPTPTPPPAQGSFLDQTDAYDTTRWAKADGWANGSPFDNAWRADHITFANSQLSISLDNTAYLGEPYSSGEYRTLGFYGYGCFEAASSQSLALG